MERGSGYGPSMPPLVAPGDFFEKLFFGQFWLRGVTISLMEIFQIRYVSLALQ